MEDKTVSTIFENACSDYGSEVDTRSMVALSDYGSDFDTNDINEDALVGVLLSQIAATAPKVTIYPNTAIQDASVTEHESVVGYPTNPSSLPWAHSSPLRARRISTEIEYDLPSRRAFSVPKEQPPQEAAARLENSSRSVDDTRSPLELFRTKPKKPLSVTDLVSPAWCELQYLYTLTEYGRKLPTRAMKAGTKIHQTLEDEVHTVVRVQTKTKEDRFGLRIWNTIQGLRCMRETGLTRELEVWGIIEGQMVNGVIDELSYTCPDLSLEERLELAKAEKSGGTLPLGQPSIEQAFAKVGPTTSENSVRDAQGAAQPDRRVYITDVKTRGVRSLPSGASLRPTWMQLMLYRKLLESLSLNTVDAETVIARYGVEPLEPFSEVFILEAGAMGADDIQIHDSNPFSVLRINELRMHPNLLALWSLMISEFQQTIPAISDILRAEFRHSKTGGIIGSELTMYDFDAIEAYVKDEIKWWEGGREAKGVEIEEAFKCRACDFAEECTWRKTKIEEATEKHRLKRTKRGKSAV